MDETGAKPEKEQDQVIDLDKGKGYSPEDLEKIKALREAIEKGLSSGRSAKTVRQIFEEVKARHEP